LAAERHDVRLRVLGPDEIPAFADLASCADVVEHAERADAADLFHWTRRPAG
jgi:hypothetical protein